MAYKNMTIKDTTNRWQTTFKLYQSTELIKDTTNRWQTTFKLYQSTELIQVLNVVNFKVKHKKQGHVVSYEHTTNCIKT